MKKILSLVLAFVLTFSLISFSVGAEDAMYDVDGNGKVNAIDVSTLQKFISGYTEEVAGNADLDGNGKVNSKDMTVLRNVLAGFVSDGPYLTDIKIGGVSISRYTIVVPAECDNFTTYSAELLADYVKDKADITLNIVDDSTAESDYEFLIGDTNRSESSSLDGVTLADDEYILKLDGTKVVMQGESYMVGGGVGKFTYDYATYSPAKRGQVSVIDNLPTDNTPLKYEAKAAKNAIIMIGDGMGFNHIKGSLHYNTIKKVDLSYTEFRAARLPNAGEVFTGSYTTTDINGSPTDSAASGTAIATGYKTENGRLGLNVNLESVQNIREVAASLGKKNAILTTDSITGATPSAFLVHAEIRHDKEAITNSINALTDLDYYGYDLDNTLLDAFKEQLDKLSTNNEKGFFTMLEEAYIDKISHNDSNNNYVKELTQYMIRFDGAIQYAMSFAVCHPDTLLLVTADHETGGMTERGRYTCNKHTTVNVPIYSIGQGTEAFTGTVDNTIISKVIAKNWGVENFGSEIAE